MQVGDIIQDISDECPDIIRYGRAFELDKINDTVSSRFWAESIEELLRKEAEYPEKKWGSTARMSNHIVVQPIDENVENWEDELK